MRFWSALVIILFVIAFSGGTAVSSNINIDVKEKVLSNGMTILVLENHDAPVFSSIVRVKVGSVDEKSGQTGLSHFCEHMMFKGTKIFGTSNYDAEVPIMEKIDSVGALLKQEWAKINSPDCDYIEKEVPAYDTIKHEIPDATKKISLPSDSHTVTIKVIDSTLYKKYREEIAKLQEEQSQYVIKDELWETYLKHGGTRLNASTGEDGTQYYVSLPANRLELWALLESDRLANTVFREFYSERDVVYEERRLRTDDQPRGKMREVLKNTALAASGYRHSVVGWASDIETWDHDLLNDYFRTYYAPNNCIAAIVGDVNADEVFELCEKYFGNIPSGPEVPIVTTREPEQAGERRAILEYDANPSVMIGWLGPAFGYPDNAALDVMSSILSSGRTSRFNRNIVEGDKIASRVSIYSSSSRYANLITASGTPIQPHTCAEVEEAIYREIDKLKTEPVSDWELQKIRNQLEADFIRGLNSNMGMAWRLSFYEAVGGDWTTLQSYHDQVKSVTAEDVMRVANKYFAPDKRTVVTLVRKASDKHASMAPGDNDVSGR